MKCKRCRKETHSTEWHDKWLGEKERRAPRSAAHAAKLAMAHIGTKASRKTKRKMSKSHRQKLANRPKGSCKMCGSLDHTYRQHQQRLIAARRSSTKWLKSVRKELRKRFKTGSRIIRFPSLYIGKHGRIMMQSSYEVKFAEKLDFWKIDWKYEPQAFYVGKGRWCGKYYLPDFYLPEFDLYIEVKGYLYAHSRRKLKEFRKKYSNIRWMLMKKDDLEMIGVFADKTKKKHKNKFFKLVG